MKSIYRLGAMCMLLLLAACDGFLDINVDPNNPSTVPNSQLLTSAELTIVNSFGVGSQGLGRTASVWVHQTMNRSNDDGYGNTGNDFSIGSAWQNLYSGALADLEVIIKEGTDREEFQYVGIAKILKAYSYSMMVDVWGDVPYSEAIQAPANPFPKYDNASEIYASLFTLIDAGIADLAKAAPATNVVPGADDVIYRGNVARWRKFAKALKLKMYNNVRLVQNVTSSVQALVADADITGLARTDDFELNYLNVAAPENRNPAFQNDYNPAFGNRLTTYISRYFYEILANKSTLNPILSGIADPRLPYYFVNQLGTNNPNPQNPVEYRDGNFLTINFSSQHPNQGFDQARSLTATGLYFSGGKYDNGTGGAVNLNSGAGIAPQRLLNLYQTLYTRAELALEASSGEDARALFESAMRESFGKLNQIAAASSVAAIPATGIDTYVTAVLAKYDAASATGKLELVLTEKWIANFGNPMETYNDYRRTGFPVMFNPTTDGDPNTNLNRAYPFAFPYRQGDLQLNANAPAQKLIGDPSSRLFWDVN
jgi:hypothetical protein